MQLPDGAEFQLMVESTFSPFCLIDAEGFIRWIGPRVEELLGHPPEHWVGRHLLDNIAPEFHELALSAYEDYIGESIPIDRWSGPPMDLELFHADGTRVPCEVSAAVGSQYGYDGLILQIRRSQGTTRLYDAIDALAVGAPVEDVLSRLAALCEHDMPGSSVTIGWNWDGDRFQHSVPPVPRLDVSVTEKEPKLTPWREAMETGEVQGGGDLAIDHPELARAVEGSGYAACWVIPITIRGDDHPRAAIVLWRRHMGGATPHHQTIPLRISRLAAFALESARTNARLERAAKTDELTGLDNRFVQRQALDDLLDGRHQDRSTTVLFCDLDDFKPVNDRYGHEFGDDVLRIVARRLSDTVRSSVSVARWGGDEFVIVIDESSPDEGPAVARRLIDVVRAPISIDGHEIEVGLSIGIARAHGDVDTDVLLRRADGALRQAKTSGKNRWVVAESAPADLVRG